MTNVFFNNNYCRFLTLIFIYIYRWLLYVFHMSLSYNSFLSDHFFMWKRISNYCYYYTLYYMVNSYLLCNLFNVLLSRLSVGDPQMCFINLFSPLHVNFDILVIIFIYFCTCFWMRYFNCHSSLIWIRSLHMCAPRKDIGYSGTRTRYPHALSQPRYQWAILAPHGWHGM